MLSLDTEVYEIASGLLGRLRRSGPDNVMAFCPYHDNRRTPSFALSLTTGLWFCHSCKERGSFKKLLRDLSESPQLIERRYGDLFEKLAQEAGSKLNRPTSVVIDLEEPPLDDSILGLFEGCPLALLEEGFLEDTLWHFDVGYDERNQRITYPLRDMLGRLVGISGRAVGDNYPRYKIYDRAEYEAWGVVPRKTRKDSLLWNFDRVYPAALHTTEDPGIILVEGFKACMWVHQAGFPNTVAMLGSHLTYQQRLLLERVGGTVYLFVDNDEAGQAARKRAAEELTQALQVKVVLYEGRQPTDLCAEDIAYSLQTAQRYIDWILTERLR